MNKEAIEREVEKMLPVIEKVQNVVAASGLSLESGCYALAAIIGCALQGCDVIESDKRVIAQTIILGLAEEYFPDLIEYVRQPNKN